MLARYAFASSIVVISSDSLKYVYDEVVTKEKVNYICDIDKESISIEEKEENFQKTLENFIKKKKN